MDDANLRRRLLMAKALGFTNSISKLSREERGQYPSGTFGEDYNRLRKSVIEGFPVIAAFVPPEAEIAKGSYENIFTAEKYGEIFAFCEQIYQLLEALGTSTQS